MVGEAGDSPVSGDGGSGVSPFSGDGGTRGSSRQGGPPATADSPLRGNSGQCGGPPIGELQADNPARRESGGSGARDVSPLDGQSSGARRGSPLNGESQSRPVVSPWIGESQSQRATSPLSGEPESERVASPLSGESPGERAVSLSSGELESQQVVSPPQIGEPESQPVTSPLSGEFESDPVPSQSNGEPQHKQVVSPRIGESQGQQAASPLSGESQVGAVQRRRPLTPVLLGLGVALLGSIVIAVGIGTVAVPVTHTWTFLRAGLFGGTISPNEVGEYRIIWDLRLPRVLLAVVVGAGLSTVGVAIQAMVRNALAEPYVLGISSGASVGATAVTLFGVFASLGIYALSVGAFVAALAATLIVYLVARTRQGLTPLRLVLTGTTLSYGFFAITTVIVFQAPNGEAARSALFWLLGSLAGANWGTLPVAAIVVVGGVLLLLALAGRLNALAMGDEAATTLGVDVGKLRVLLFIVCAAMTGVLVAVSGAIGFVGLILPHLVRLVVGADHRRVLAVAPLAGAIFLVWVDVAARVLAAPEELPIGVLTAAVGVPAFLLLMRRRAYVFGGA